MSTPPLNITDLDSGCVRRLAEVDGERSLRRRLMELGLLPGTPVRVVRKVSIGDLIELEVRGCLVSLRLAEARRVFVELAHG